MSDPLRITILVIVALPFVVYAAVKFGTFAFFRARQLFNEQENRRNGDKTKEA